MEEVCEYCNRKITDQEQAYVFRGKVACEQCDRKLRSTPETGIDQTENVFVVIRYVCDQNRRRQIHGIQEKLRVERKCVYCDHIQEPDFDNPRYARGYCWVKSELVDLGHTCEKFNPNQRSSWWLQKQCVSGMWPVWWLTYSDEKRQQREEKSRKELLPKTKAQIDIELETLSSFEIANPGYMCLNPDGRFVAGQYTSDVSLENFKIGVWDICEGKQIHEISLKKLYSHHFCFSPNGRLIAGLHSHTVSVWERATGITVKSTSLPTGASLTSLVFTADGRNLLVGDQSGKLMTWDIEQDLVSDDLKTPRLREGIKWFSLSSDGKMLAAATGENTVYIFDTGRWQVVKTLGHHALGGLCQVHFHPRAAQLISVTRDSGDPNVAEWRLIETGQIRLWDLQRAKVLREFPCHGAACFDETGRLVLGIGDNGIDVWEVSTGAKIRTIPMKQRSGLYFASKAPILAITESVFKGVGKLALYKVRINDLY